MNNKHAIKFENLTYTASHGVIQKSTKEILKGVSGAFNHYELTGIIGLSGCGKSTLLNVITGFVNGGITGELEVNNSGKKCFIMQEENLHELLTVEESMLFAINLKTGYKLTLLQRREKVKNILANLGLGEKCQTSVSRLSGGQQKRLSIAQELVDNPAMIFLDEPTTGLDSSSSTQCVELLRRLTRQGKTVICTIHTPSAFLFKSFDHVYAMVDGKCCYQGSPTNLVQFMADCNIECPSSYNPSDYLMESASGDYGHQASHLVATIKNGMNECYREPRDTFQIFEFFQKDNKTGFSATLSTVSTASFFEHIDEIRCLMKRNFMLAHRDPTNIWLRIVLHIAVALLVGFTYLGTGSNAKQLIGSFKLIYAMSLFLTYTGFYSMFTKFSIEEATVRRERFNKWYSTSSYFLAMSIVDIPVIAVCVLFLTSIIYFMSDQPNDNDRYWTLFGIQTLLSFVAQGFGMMIGAIFQLMDSLFFAAAILPVVALFGGFIITQKDANQFFFWAFDLNFLKQAGDSSLSTVMGYNRTKLECREAMYCHFQRSTKLLNTLGIGEEITEAQIVNLLIMLIVFRLVAYIMIRYRLKG